MSSEASGSASASNGPPEREAMGRALDLALRGWGRVAPNPLVGAVVLQGGTVAGEGFHAEFGGPHAEVVALAAAGERARGSTVVVTLEPCAHHGKTPPCTEAIVAAGGTTALRDDPQLTVRGPVTPRRPPVRVVFDRRAMLNETANLVNTAREKPTWVMASPDAPAGSVALLERSGVRVFRPASLADGLRMLRSAGIHSVLCEGGGALGAKLLAEGLVDRLYWVQAPVWLGEGAVPAFPGVAGAALPAAPRWIPVERRAMGPDTLLVLDRRLCLPES